MNRKKSSRRRRRRQRFLCLLAPLLLVAALGPLLGRSPEATPTPPVAEQIPTSPAPVPADNWALALVNGSHPLPADAKIELTKITSSGHQLDSRAAPFLENMLADMRKAGLSPLVCSAYRTQSKQQSLFDRQLNKQKNRGLAGQQAVAAASNIVAYPGTSEHQLGLAVDIVSTDQQVLDENQRNTPENQWLLQHCAEYGFILRYPEDKTEITNVIYEPWHFRYVGTAAAKEITEQVICLEEYLEQQGPQ